MAVEDIEPIEVEELLDKLAEAGLDFDKVVPEDDLDSDGREYTKALILKTFDPDED